MLDLRETVQQRLRDGARERLEQAELTRFRDLLQQLDDLAVVDRVLDPVRARLRKLEADVVQERLLAHALDFPDAVAARDLQPCELHDHVHESAAAAAVSASTCTWSWSSQ